MDLPPGSTTEEYDGPPTQEYDSSEQSAIQQLSHMSPTLGFSQQGHRAEAALPVIQTSTPPASQPPDFPVSLGKVPSPPMNKQRSPSAFVKSPSRVQGCACTGNQLTSTLLNVPSPHDLPTVELKECTVSEDEDVSVPPNISHLLSPSQTMDQTVSETQGMREKLSPADLDITDLTKAFRDASLSSPQDTRLLLALPTSATLGSAAAVPLDRAIGTWSVTGVVQRPEDVHLCVNIPVHESSDERTERRMTASTHRFNVFYDPDRDSCVLENRVKDELLFDCLDPNPVRKRVDLFGTATLEPGLWRVSWSDVKHILDMLILPRQFTFTVHEKTVKSTSNKRKRRDETLNVTSAKRFKKASNGTTRLFSLPTVRIPATSPVEPTMRSLTTATSKVGSPLLQLKKGDTGLVRTGSAQSEEEEGRFYEISHVRDVAETGAASVFAARHSEHVEDVVTKVIVYSNGTYDPQILIRCARSWHREVRMLKRLNHRNVISLKSSDARLFALYLEHLPRSLSHDRLTCFSTSAAYDILRDMSSALVYLKQQGIVHNDIKPGNITYSRERGAVLIDFGLATLDDRDPSGGGTHCYIPPEYLDPSQSRNLCGDVWALGVTMLYVLDKICLPESLVRGWYISEAADEGSDAHRRMMAWLETIARVRQQLSKVIFIERLVRRMLEPDPRRRIEPAQMVAAFEENSAQPRHEDGT